jgi:23S rRNA pseudouridine2605 synthase
VTAADRIEIDGQPVSWDQGLTSQIIVLNKAGGLVCSRRDPEKRGTIFDTLPKIPGSRWVTVGRLDVQTTGLLLVTNDGGLAHRMMHPSTGLDREYAVRVNAKLEDNAIARLKTGVEIEGQTMRFSDIRYYNGSENNFWYHVALTEGRNREVRRLFESAGCLVSRLKRVRYGPVVLPSWLTVGQWASLRQEDIKLLYRMLGLPRPEQTGPKLKRSKVAKTSCLIPYPKLSAAKSSAKEKIPSVMALSLATDLDFAVDNARDGGGKKIKVDSASGTAGHGFQRQPRPALGKAEIKSTKKTAQASSGKTKKTKDGGIKKVSTKRGRKKAVDNRAGSEQKKDGIAKARGKGNAAKSRSRGGALT